MIKAIHTKVNQKVYFKLLNLQLLLAWFVFYIVVGLNVPRFKIHPRAKRYKIKVCKPALYDTLHTYTSLSTRLLRHILSVSLCTTSPPTPTPICGARKCGCHVTCPPSGPAKCPTRPIKHACSSQRGVGVT